MNDNKMDKLREKLNVKKTQLNNEMKATEIAEDLKHTVYDIYQDPSKKGRNFLIVQIKFDPECRKAAVTDVREFEDKTAGLSFVMNKRNLEYLFNKCKRSQT